MSMLSVLIKDLVEKTTLEDGTYLVAGTTDANKITFLNLVNAIKKKFGAAAQKSVANNLTTAASGTSVLDAYQGKLLSDKIDSLNDTIGNTKSDVDAIKAAISPTIGEDTDSTHVVSLLNGSIKIAGISKVATMTSNYIKVTDSAEICKLFDIPSVDPKKITIISCNGDWNANHANFFAVSLKNDTWWQYSDTKVSVATPTRLNIFIIYID